MPLLSADPASVAAELLLLFTAAAGITLSSFVGVALRILPGLSAPAFGNLRSVAPFALVTFPLSFITAFSTSSFLVLELAVLPARALSLREELSRDILLLALLPPRGP